VICKKQTEDCKPYTAQQCRITAERLGLQLGGHGHAFESSGYSQKGCYAYSSGPYAGMAFYGSGASDQWLIIMRNTNSASTYRPSGYDCSEEVREETCVPYTATACRIAAKALGLTIGGAGFPFEVHHRQKGCYVYNSGKYAGRAFYGLGGSQEEIRDRVTLDGSTYRPVGWDCKEQQAEETCGWCRLRRDWNSMSEDDRKEYIDTVNIARKDERFKSQYDELVMSHGQLVMSHGYAIHGEEEFLAWHRWFIFEYENILRQITPCITVPYWAWEVAGSNWMQDEMWGSADHQFGRCGNGDVKDGPFSDMILPGTSTRLSRNCGGSIPKLHTMTHFLNSASTDFGSFFRELRDVHDQVHVRIGGSMEDILISSMAPEFFLHHNNVERMWTNWQLQSDDHKFAQPNRHARLTGAKGYTIADFTRPHNLGTTFEDLIHRGELGTCVIFEDQQSGNNSGRRRLSSKATKVNLAVTMSNQLPTDSVFESLLVYTEELSLQVNEDFEAAQLMLVETQRGGSLSDERAHEIAHEHQENSEWGRYIKEMKVDTEYAPDSKAKAFFADIVGITVESVRYALEVTHKLETLRTFDSQLEELEQLFSEN